MKTNNTNGIVQQEDKVLREEAKPVAEGEFGTPELIRLVEKMNAALATCDDGVALAAPQIGVSKRLFVVAKKIFSGESDLVFINPEIIKISRAKKVLEEGCLSVRWKYGEVKRAEKVTLQAFDINGKKVTRHASGLLAQIFQHEVDHLNGDLFIDKAKNLHEIKPEDLQKHSA
jgi:peptide deformylase